MVPAAAIWGLLELVSAAITAYETYELLRDLYDDIGKFEASLEKAKEEIRKKMETLKDEIAANIDEKSERALLLKLTQNDKSQQSETTQKALGRTGDADRTQGASSEILAAIPQRIPFRKVITMVCEFANRMPVLSLRRKRGVNIKDLPTLKKKLLLELIALSAEELAEIDDIDAFIVVRLRQLMANHIFELMDELLNWTSPLKAEACFGKQPGFADPKLSGTRLTRLGNSINPFWPVPHGKGSIAADLAIPDYRRRPLTKDNLFAIVEIKFEGDAIKNEQFKNYEKLSKVCAEVKTDAIGKANTAHGKGVTLGCRVSLFRYPEDIAVDPPEKDKTKPAEKKKKPKTRRTKTL